MSKLALEDQFFDFSDYGRSFGKAFANRLKTTSVTPIHVTLLFGISGLLAIYFILNNSYFVAGFFIVLKSGIDAADGELSRIKNTPSYSGRYLDSIFDIALNFLFILTICYSTQTPILIGLIAFVGIQLQGTLYNYYYVILRNKSIGGDVTSKIFERKSPIAFAHENQRLVNVLFKIFNFCYRLFDRIIFNLDPLAIKVSHFPNWFMTLVSLYGLGFQLLIIAVMLPLGCIEYIIPFFIIYTAFLIIPIGIRKMYIK
jgi:phosphatidylglycerophosphate synthase